MPTARGSVYLLADQPILQLHLFPQAYTFLWHSDLSDRIVRPTIVASLREAIPRVTDALPVKESILSLSALLYGDEPSSPNLIEHKETIQVSRYAPGSVADRLDTFTGTFWNRTVSFYAELSHSSEEPTLVALRTDTMATPITEKETGVMAAYGIAPVQLLGTLLLRTAPAFKQLSNARGFEAAYYDITEFLRSVVRENALDNNSLSRGEG